MTSVGIDGNQRTLVSASDSRSVSEARLAVGSVSVDNNNDYLTDTGPFVYFIDGNGEIARVDSSGTVETVYKGISAQAVTGTGDIDGDGAPELVYVDSNVELAYVDERANGKVQKRSLDDSPTLNTANAVGAPAGFDGDGAAEIPFINGDTDVKYVNGPGGPTGPEPRQRWRPGPTTRDRSAPRTATATVSSRSSTSTPPTTTDSRTPTHRTGPSTSRTEPGTDWRPSPTPALHDSP